MLYFVPSCEADVDPFLCFDIATCHNLLLLSSEIILLIDEFKVSSLQLGNLGLQITRQMQKWEKSILSYFYLLLY